ncbi:MAG: hypothetical protein JWQ35_2512 [Bacteriovoracaceae bacterium]|nr:hypothetical protein [Bacteriovoracaceae bacterium]
MCYWLIDAVRLKAQEGRILTSNRGVRVFRKVLSPKNFLTLMLLSGASLFRAEATTISGGSIQELGQQAVWIGRLQIESIQTISSSAEFPLSQIKGKILEVFKGQGNIDQEISFEVPGGQRGSKSFSVMGFPNFKVGSEYVLFLDSDPRFSSTALSLSAASAGLVGWSAFRVMTSADPQDVSKVVVRAGEPTLLQRSSRGLAITHDRTIKRYEDFVSEIYRSLD